MELINQLQPLLYAVFAAVFGYMREAWQWWVGQVLTVPWGRIGELPGSKVLLLIASAGVVAYFLFAPPANCIVREKRPFPLL